MSRQVHGTLNGVNPSSGFRDMRSTKSGPNLWQIWQVFGPWASPYAANGQMTMTVHNYRPRQFHRTSNGENLWSGYRDMGFASLAAARPPARTVTKYPSSPEGWGVKIHVAFIHISWQEMTKYSNLLGLLQFTNASQYIYTQLTMRLTIVSWYVSPNTSWYILKGS